MKKIVILTIITFGLFSPSAYAESRPEFLHIGIEDGLSNGSITSITQDSLAFIWIGTKHGLNRYDGARFKLYNLPGNDISVLHIDGENRFWTGTVGNGLFLYNPLNDSFEQISLACSEIHALFSKGNLLWIASENGLYSYNPVTKTSKHYRHKSDKSSGNDIRAMAETPENKIYLGTFGSGLHIFDTKSETFHDFNTTGFSGLTINSDYINALFTDKNGRLLVGANENGLKQIDFQKKTITNYLANTAYSDNTIIRCIRQDEDGNLWIGTDGAGILHIENPESQQPVIHNYRSNRKTSNSLSDNTINTFFVDRQSNRWIGTAKRGLDVVKKQPAGIEYYYSDGKGENKLPVLSVFRDKKRLWMGTDGEGMTLLNLENQRITIFSKTSPDEYLGDFVQCIKPIGNNKLGIGTYAHGFYIFDTHTRKITNFNRKPGLSNSLPHNDVRDFVTMPSGDLWIATWGGGLAFYDANAKTVKTYKHEPENPNSPGSDNILALHLDNRERLWLATYSGGLSMLDIRTKKFKNFKSEDFSGLKSNLIFALLAESERMLLIGTKEGICRLDLQTLQFEAIPIEADYPSQTIQSLVKDGDGNIWAGTKKGILRLQCGSKKIEFLPGIYDNFQINSACIDESGKLYFGGNEGVIAFHPSEIRFDIYQSPIYLTGFLLFNKPAPIGGILKHQICYEKEITLKHNQSVITVEYAALDFPFSKNINYEIMLEGLESEWRNVGNQNTATFTNLSAGKYTFKVRLAHSEGFTMTLLEIKILPPFWLAWWAYLLYALILAAIFYIFRRYTLEKASIQNELKLEKIKQRFFINISHDIRTPLTLISASVNKLFNRNNIELLEQKDLTTIKANTNRLLHLTEELLNYRKLETGNVVLQISYEDIVEFVREIYVCYSQLAIHKNIKYEFSHSQPEIYVWIDKTQMEKAIGNLISNAFKFTPEGGTIKVDVGCDSANQIVIRVSDTGKGIAPNKIGHIFNRFYQAEKNAKSSGFGIGLSITHEIVILHGGKINVSSEIGRGSEFSITLQNGKEHFKNAEFIETPLKDNLLAEHFICDDSISKAVPKQEAKEYSILIVEDNVEIRTYLSELLSLRYQVYEASNGQEALDIALELMPDLVVSDIMMPMMDGITFCHKLKNDIRISHIPVILLTARTLADSIIEGFETGADEYLTKPFNERILLARISNILQNRQEIRKRVQREMILNPKEISLNTQDGIFLSKLVAYIEDHLGESDFNIAQMAAEMAMSHSNLYKKVKALVGMTIIGFVKDFKLKRAAQLLAQNELSITEIAYMVGYSDRRNFSRDFKKEFSLTPKEYGEKNQRQANNLSSG